VGDVGQGNTSLARVGEKARKSSLWMRSTEWENDETLYSLV